MAGRKRRPTSSVGVLMTREEGEEGGGGEVKEVPLTGYRSLPSPQTRERGLKAKKKVGEEKKEKKERGVEKKKSQGEIKKKLPKAR